MDKTLLAICPSRGRPDIIMEMIKSFVETRSPGNDLVVYLNDDDPRLPEYYRNFEEFIVHEPEYPKWFKVLTAKRRNIVEVYNYLATAYIEYDYYAPINDDHIFHTYHWDEKLIKVVEEKGAGWGLAMADDLLTDFSTSMHPSGCVISGNIIRALGYMVWLRIHHIGTDTFLQKICEGINRLFLVKDVVIEHRHWLNGRRPLDDNYKWVYGGEEQKYGADIIQLYLYNYLQNDIDRLREAMALENNRKND